MGLSGRWLDLRGVSSFLSLTFVCSRIPIKWLSRSRFHMLLAIDLVVFLLCGDGGVVSEKKSRLYAS